MVYSIKNATQTVKIALVGKYVKMYDTYLSVAEALRHGGIENHVKVDIEWVESEDITDETVEKLLGGIDGIIVPGGFGDRGIEGMIVAARYARENNIPYFGICLGMQIAVIEYARNVLGYKDANSGEFAQTKHNVIDLMPDQRGNVPKGATMRLGGYECVIKDKTLMKRCYGVDKIVERHRHRYEFNNDFREEIEKAGMDIVGTSPNGELVEAVEIPKNDFYIGVQFHPEFKSRPNKAHPIFREFIKAAKK